MAKSNPGKPIKSVRKSGGDERSMRKELSKVEKTIARLDKEKSELNAQLLNETDPDEALRLHNSVEELQQKLNEAESRWCELQEELESSW